MAYGESNRHVTLLGHGHDPVCLGPNILKTDADAI